MVFFRNKFALYALKRRLLFRAILNKYSNGKKFSLMSSHGRAIQDCLFSSWLRLPFKVVMAQTSVIKV